MFFHPIGIFGVSCPRMRACSALALGCAGLLTLAGCSDDGGSGGDGASADGTGGSGDGGPGDGGSASGSPTGGGPGPADGSDTGNGTATDDGPDPDSGSDSGATAWGAHCPGEPAYELGTPIWVGGGGVDGRVSVTLDGETWTDATTASLGPIDVGHTRNLIRGVGYGGGTFVVVGGYDNGYVSISCDGVTWDRDVLGTNIEGELPAPYTDFLSDVAYLDGVFVAAGGAGARLTSTDMGLTWTPTHEYESGHFRGIATGNGRFVATGHTWGTGESMTTTSTDGMTWTPVLLQPGELGGVVFGDGVFVSTGGTRCATTTDGEAWTDCALPSIPDTIAGAEFTNGTFYVQFLDGQYATSDDGLAWSALQDGWLPDTFQYGEDRYVMARWGARGWSTTVGDWNEVSFPPEEGLSQVVFGYVGG